ncbi:MAG: type II secretion system protein [Desulfuromonas sp.]|uniref:cohesin domain-containing protein n=1 Tax=Desulfuromonas sp. TaxID=892 RepID=UPI000CA7F1CE|nr:cohesin domain-containing protein [Desulfuromonas sp.]PLX83103.1 MAG: type II secretion system protein [Desulfuromonas sp.]
MDRSIIIKAVVFLALLGLFTGCAAQRAFLAGEDLTQEGRFDEAVAKYSEAVAARPESHEYRMMLQNARVKAAQKHLEQGRFYLDEGRFPEAVAELRLAGGLDPTLEVAGQERRRAEELIRAQFLVAEAEGFIEARRLSQARNTLNKALVLDPGNSGALGLLDRLEQEQRTVIDGFELDLSSEKPITLKFKEAKIEEVFNILSRLSGINFIFDKELKSQKVTVLLENVTFVQALELLLDMNKLDKKVLNSKTIILYPKTKDKGKQYQDFIIQTFYLSNIDAKKAVNLLRTMLQLRKIYVHEELNALVIRDTPEVIKLAQQIIVAADRADAEVVFDLELLEVSHGNDLSFGPKLSSYSVSGGYGGAPGADTLVADGLSPGGSTANLIGSLSSLESFYTLPTASFDFAKTLTDSEILANPKIRVKNKDKGKVHIGTREPVITVTTTGDTSTDNIQYVDVGVKLDVEPTIQLDNTVVTKLSLEVSSVSDRTTTTNGSVALTITTTNAQSVLTLKDGQQTVIGGLIRDDFSKSKTTFPLLGRLPLIGDLISGHTRNKQKREILLSITPHIVKAVELPRSNIASIWSGKEDDFKAGPSMGSFATASFEPDAEMALPSSAPAKKLASAGRSAGQNMAPPGETSGIAQAIPEAGSDMPTLLFFEGRSDVEVNQEFSLQVHVSGARDLYSAPLFVNYDPEAVEFVRAEEGDFLGSEGRATVFSSSAVGEEGQLIVGHKVAKGMEGASGDGILFELVFKAKAAGRTNIDLGGVNFQDSTGRSLPAEAGGQALEVR